MDRRGNAAAWVAPQSIDQCEQAHALVMRHEGPDGDARLARRQTPRRVVDGLVEAAGAGAPLDRKPLQVLAGFGRCKHQRHGGRVRGDHQILGQAAFQTQTGTPKARY